uniref:Uncharacterized protein n=1 Tax=Glossina palpalis gambiensis TaxID=67801 RepID=A0A1B0BK50_9MUSC
MAPGFYRNILAPGNNSCEIIQLAGLIGGAQRVFPTAVDTRPVIKIVCGWGSTSPAIESHLPSSSGLGS